MPGIHAGMCKCVKANMLTVVSTYAADASDSWGQKSLVKCPKMSYLLSCLLTNMVPASAELLHKNLVVTGRCHSVPLLKSSQNKTTIHSPKDPCMVYLPIFNKKSTKCVQIYHTRTYGLWYNSQWGWHHWLLLSPENTGHLDTNHHEPQNHEKKGWPPKNHIIYLKM